ncbi:MAG: hypothetical protein ABEJ97_01735 [Halobellus sp.]
MTTGPRFGEFTTCELCESETRCFEKHGFTACLACHRDLLPGGTVF